MTTAPELCVGLIHSGELGPSVDPTALTVTVQAICRALAEHPGVSRVVHVRPVPDEDGRGGGGLGRRTRRRVDAVVHRLCDKVEDAVATLLGLVTGKGLAVEQALSAEAWRAFQDKLAGEVTLRQRVKGVFSETGSSEALAAHEIDFLIRGTGLKIERGEILSEGSAHGVISFHHGDNRLNRGGPVGFWECVFGEPSGITVQRIDHELDGGATLYRSRFQSLSYPAANRRKIYSMTYATLACWLSRFVASGLTREEGLTALGSVYTRGILKMPGFHVRLAWSARFIGRMVLSLPRRVWAYVGRKLGHNPGERWSVAVSATVAARLEKWLRPIPDDPRDWCADPFLFSLRQRTYLIYEKYIFHHRRGVIACAEIVGGPAEALSLGAETVLVDTGEHLSYPFTFARAGSVWCIPENQSLGLTLYELVEVDGGVVAAVPRRKLLEGPWVDATLLTTGGLDYLFVNPAQREVLELYVTGDILTEPLARHPMSPVMVDARFARSAGTIVEADGRHYRPSQDCTFGYGEAVAFSEIRVTSSSFASAPTPYGIEGSGNLKRLHHVCRVGDLTAIDYVA